MGEPLRHMRQRLRVGPIDVSSQRLPSTASGTLLAIVRLKSSMRRVEASIGEKLEKIDEYKARVAKLETHLAELETSERNRAAVRAAAAAASPEVKMDTANVREPLNPAPKSPINPPQSPLGDSAPDSSMAQLEYDLFGGREPPAPMLPVVPPSPEAKAKPATRKRSPMSPSEAPVEAPVLYSPIYSPSYSPIGPEYVLVPISPDYVHYVQVPRGSQGPAGAGSPQPPPPLSLGDSALAGASGSPVSRAGHVFNSNGNSNGNHSSLLDGLLQRAADGALDLLELPPLEPMPPLPPLPPQPQAVHHARRPAKKPAKKPAIKHIKTRSEVLQEQKQPPHFMEHTLPNGFSFTSSTSSTHMSWSHGPVPSIKQEPVPTPAPVPVVNLPEFTDTEMSQSESDEPASPVRRRSRKPKAKKAKKAKKSATVMRVKPKAKPVPGSKAAVLPAPPPPEEICPVCHDVLEEGKCGVFPICERHKFCFDCLPKLDIDTGCPCCRKFVEVGSLDAAFAKQLAEQMA